MSNIREMTDATGRRMADALEHLSGSGKSGAKFPNIDAYDLFKLANFAGEHAHSATNEINIPSTPRPIYASPITTDPVSPLNAFLIGLEHLSDLDIGDEGRVAYISYNYMRMLMMEATRFNLTSQLKYTDGLLKKISKCPVVEVSNEHMPGGAAFLILSSGLVRGLNELDAQGKLHDDEAIAAVLNANADGLYYHGNQAVLKNLDVTVTPLAGGKLHFTFAEPREKDTNKFYVLTKPTAADLPDATFNNMIDISSSSSAWAGAESIADTSQPVDQTEFDYILPSGHTSDAAVVVVETMRNMKPVGIRKLEYTPIA